MTAPVYLALLGLAVGCSHAPCPASTRAAPLEVDATAPARTGVDLEWSVQVDGERLRIDYTVRDDTDQAIYLLDQLVAGGDVDPDAVLVRNGDAPGVVVFARRFMWADATSLTAALPIARRVEAHATVTGTGRVPLPLRAWHNFSRFRPLEGPMTVARLELGYVVDSGPDVVESATFNGQPVLYSTGVDNERTLVGHELPLPPEARNVDPTDAW